LAGIVTLALVLRLWGIRFGFPYAYHFDEPTYVRIALNLGEGLIGRQPNPTGFSNLLFAEYGVYFIAGRIGGHLASAAEAGQFWRANPTAFHILLGRLTNALLGTLGVLVAYWLGKEAGGRGTGLLAALFLAVSFLHVRNSHYVTPGITAASLTSLGVLCSLLAMRIPMYSSATSERRSGSEKSRRRYLVLAAAAAGYAIATKWSVWPVIIPLAVAVSHGLWLQGCQEARSRLAYLALAVGSFGGGFLAGGFQLVLKPLAYWNYALLEREAGQEGGFWIWQIGTVPGWLFYVKVLYYGWGGVLLGLASVGFLRRLVRVITRGDRMSILLLSFPLLYYASMGSTRHYFARYALPLLPFGAVFAAEALMVGSAWVRRRRVRWGRCLAMALAIASIAQPLAWSIRHDVLLTRQDTRTLAKEWIEAHIPPGAKIATDWPVYEPPLSRETYEVDTRGGEGLSGRPLAWYREQGFDYLIASSFIYRITLLDKEQDARRRAFYAALDEELELVRRFSPGEGNMEPPFVFDEIYGPWISVLHRERPGPVLKIYRVK
jgi:hypothetical protein